MSAASIARSIAQLEATGRARSLTDKESLLLEQLIEQERRAAGLPRRHQKPRRKVEPPTLEQFLETTLDGMREDGMSPSAIYLAPCDLITAAAHGIDDSFRGVPVRPLKRRGRSRIYSSLGFARTLGQHRGVRGYPFISSSPAGSVESLAGGGNAPL